MEFFDLKKLNKCFVCGSIDKNIEKFIQDVSNRLTNYAHQEHPKELERKERLKMKSMRMSAYERARDSIRNERSFKKKMHDGLDGGAVFNDSLILVSGSCGIGSKSLEYYKSLFGKLDEDLRKNNCYVFFIRGNNDDPSIFNERKINFEHVKTIPDYSLVCLNTLNCLCIGGSISIDKEWKLAQEKMFGKKLYWEGEAPYFDIHELDEIIAKHKIGCVVTSSSPSFAYPGTNSFNKSKWLKENPSIKNSLSKERKVFDKIYERLVEKDVKPYVWLYGKFKLNNTDKINDIVFKSMSTYNFVNVEKVIYENFNITLSKELGSNSISLDMILDDCFESKEIRPRAPIEEFMDEEDVDEAVEEVEGEPDGIRQIEQIEEPRFFERRRNATTDATDLYGIQAHAAHNINEIRNEMPRFDDYPLRAMQELQQVDERAFNRFDPLEPFGLATTTTYTINNAANTVTNTATNGQQY